MFGSMEERLGIRVAMCLGSGSSSSSSPSGAAKTRYDSRQASLERGRQKQAEIDAGLRPGISTAEKQQAGVNAVTAAGAAGVTGVGLPSSLAVGGITGVGSLVSASLD